MRSTRQAATGNAACARAGRRGRLGARIAGLCAAAWLGTAPDVAAAGRDGVVRCESGDMRRMHCPMDTAGGVVLVRQLSESPCIRETGWGVDRHGVWVALGCRAEFRPAVAAASVQRQVVRCESSGRQRSCAVSLRGAPVRLLRQLSAWPCRRGETWGVGRNEVWVSRGCKGEFEVGDRDGGFPPGARLLTCESRDRIRRYCGATIEREARLQRQLSGMPCEQGRNWGWDADGVWVDKGCRAEFRVE